MREPGRCYTCSLEGKKADEKLVSYSEFPKNILIFLSEKVQRINILFETTSAIYHLFLLPWMSLFLPFFSFQEDV